MGRSKKIDNKVAEAKTSLLDPTTGKVVDANHKGQILCVYAPCTWPFIFKGFFKNFLRLLHPVNIIPLRKYGITDYFPLTHDSFPICRNRNEAVYVSLMYNVSWMLFLDADMTFPTDIIPQLVRHQQPIVAGMYFHKSKPHMPVIYNRDEEKGPHHYKHFISYPKYDLFEVDMTGMGCMLVNMEVFRNIQMPYFDYLSTREDGLKNVTEDVIFCEKVREAGYKIMIDPTVKCKHITTDEIGEEHFDVYMETYKTSQRLLEEFGDGSGMD